MKETLISLARHAADRYPLAFLALLVATAFGIAFGLLSVAAMAVTT